MTLPAQIAVSFDYSSGATFGTGFVIGDSQYGVIGVSRFGSSQVVTPVVDLTPNVYSIKIQRGRNIMRDTFESGTATVRVYDPDSNFNPQNVNSIYYPYLTPLRKLRISATVGATEEFLFSGYITDYKYSYDQEQRMGYVDISANDAFRLLQMANVSTIATTPAGQTTGTRIEKILDDIQFPTSMRSIATGDYTVAADPGDLRSTLEAIKNVEFVEQGAFFIDGFGTATFKSRTEILETLGAPALEFNQDGTGIPYANLKFAFDDKLIINSCTLSRIGGSEITVFDQDSIDKYFPHSVTQGNLVAQTDAQVEDIARLFVSTRKDTTIRIDEMVIDLQDTAVPTADIIGLDFFQNLEISNNQPDGSVLTKTLQCQGIAWDIAPNKMIATITTLEPIANGFVIGDSNWGIIGVSTF